MLFSHNQDNEKLKQFTIFLDYALKGNRQYADIVNNVLLETHQYAAGDKTMYNITRDLLHIILFLSDADKNYFSALKDNPDSYDQQTYSKVLGFIKQPLQPELY